MSWIAKLKNGLKGTSTKITGGVSSIFTSRRLDATTLNELEELLIMADMGVESATEIVEELRKDRFGKDISEEEIKTALAGEIVKIIGPSAKELVIGEHKPHVILVVGVNGNGKTTSIGKLAHNLRLSGKKVLVAAADTFRAAAIGQLRTWAERAGVAIHAGNENQDPASVAYQALDIAAKENYDVVLIDTAGRLQNKLNLMNELNKIRNVCTKFNPGSPHDVILVLDATTGQNAISQVQEFGEKAGVTGLVVTKLDGTAKGGIVVALAKKFGLAVYAIGVGEGIDDMKPFNAHDFANSLVGLE